MKLITIEPRYIEYLAKVDSRVRFNNGSRPYVGVVLHVGRLSYFAPLESIHKVTSFSSQLVVKVWGKSLNGEQQLLSVVRLNNMIPVSQAVCLPIDVQQLRSSNITKYNLLLKELNFLRVNSEVIKHKAAKLYKLRTTKQIAFIESICVDFKVLEQACCQYN